MKAQTRMASLREAWINILIGFTIQFAANYFVLPVFGMHPSVADLFGLGGIFTVISVVRSYVLRRVFEKKRAADVPPDFQHVIEEIAAERQGQIGREGYTLDHDDGHREGELARAAAAYVYAAVYPKSISRSLWPFDDSTFRVTTPRRSLVKAAALIIAEVGRMDRYNRSGA